MIVRLLVGDDPRQTPIAEQAFREAIASGGVYLPDVVLAEVAWCSPLPWLRPVLLTPMCVGGGVLGVPAPLSAR